MDKMPAAALRDMIMQYRRLGKCGLKVMALIVAAQTIRHRTVF